MTNEKKITNKSALQYVIEKCEIPQEVKEKLEKMIEQLDKKASTPKKLTKEQENNIVYKQQILEVMSTEEGETVTDIMKKLPAQWKLFCFFMILVMLFWCVPGVKFSAAFCAPRRRCR